MLRVTTGNRLHFGLISLDADAPRRFGGVGLMLEHPELCVSAEPAVEWSASGPLAERSLAFALRFAESVGIVRPQHLVVESAPPEHVGRLAAKLRSHGVETAAMHGDLTQGARERALERFRSGKVTTLVATDVAARGLDLEAIEHVINYDPPEDTKGYIHRVGRTGRAGNTGQGTTLVLPDQQADVSRVANLLGHREKFEEAGMETARPRLLYTSRRGRRSRW